MGNATISFSFSINVHKIIYNLHACSCSCYSQITEHVEIHVRNSQATNPSTNRPKTLRINPQRRPRRHSSGSRHGFKTRARELENKFHRINSHSKGLHQSPERLASPMPIIRTRPRRDPQRRLPAAFFSGKNWSSSRVCNRAPMVRHCR